MRACVRVCVRACARARVCACACVYARARTSVCVCVCVCVLFAEMPPSCLTRMLRFMVLARHGIDRVALARPLGMRIRTRALASEPDDAVAERTARRGLAESLDEGHAGPAATTTCMATRGSTCCSDVCTVIAGH